MSATSELFQKEFKLYPISRTMVNHCYDQTSKQIIILQGLKIKLSKTMHFEESIIIGEICKKLKAAEALMKLVIENDQ